MVAAPQFPLTNDHTKGGPDAGDVVNQPADMSFVISSVVKASAGTGGTLNGMVDSLEIGAAGHSNGAITTLGLIANSCCRDRRIKAAVVMAGDDVAFPGGTYDLADTPPLLLVHGTADELLPYTLAIGMFNQARGPKGLVTIEGGGHESAAGLAASSSASVLRATTDFFRAYLSGDRAAFAHIAGDGQHGVTSVRFDPKVGSTATIPFPRRPRLRSARDGDTDHGPRGRSERDGAMERLHPRQGCQHPAVRPDRRAVEQLLGLRLRQCQDPHARSGRARVRPTQGRHRDGRVGRLRLGPPGCLIVVNDASSTAPTASVRVPISFGP